MMKTHCLKISTLSPVFIGGKHGLDLNPWKYVRDDKKIYVIN